MEEYFSRDKAMAARIGTEVKTVLKIIANRFCADNPPAPVLYGYKSVQGFNITEDYLDEIRLHEKYPQMEPESYVYAWAQLHVSAAGDFHFRFGAYGPVAIYVNGAFACQTSHIQERFSHEITDISLNLKEGINELLFECTSTPLGCGFRIGSSSYKGRRIQFFAPDEEHQGLNGFLYSAPLKSRLKEVKNASELVWYPKMQWDSEQSQKSVSERLYGRKPMIAVTSLDCPVLGEYTLEGYTEKGAAFYIDGEKRGGLKGSFHESVRLSGGCHLLAFLGGDVLVTIRDKDGAEVKKQCPVRLLSNREQEWLYAGPFEEETPSVRELLAFDRPFMADNAITFWRPDLPGLFLRPFNEGVLYGEWSYPLGVTLYGLIQSARLLKDSLLEAYVEGHMKKCAEFYDYCMWDKMTYGAAPFHNQLTTIDSLDDCGSFASALLEVMKDHKIPHGGRICAMVANYMEEKQQKLHDGTFYRNHSYLPIMNETLWADDMYMSIPFLCRYFTYSGDVRYLDDAAQQAKRFFSYLYMPSKQLMSHIYDIHYEVQTKVSWGRGNGWALFSLTELLAVMPEEHEDRLELLEIFQTLCDGYKKRQDISGMFHQVLDMEDSYLETSATAMFVYGFARGVRYGWLQEADSYAKAAYKGWQGLCRKAVDWKGNIYGVCKGSGYSFSREYYARDLGWNFNDTHGTGIVLLAGIEVEKMQESKNKEAAHV